MDDRRVLEFGDIPLQSALHDVAVPADYSRNLLARLAVTEPVVDSNHAEIQLAPAAPSMPRRRQAGIAAAIAASLLVALTGVITFNMSSQGPADVSTLASSWQKQLGDKWQPINSAPQKYSLPNSLSVRPTGWQALSSFQSYRGVAYKIGMPGGQHAVLFVVRVSSGGQLPKSPPHMPQFSSGGRAVGAWLADNRMFVLVIDGDERAYRSLLRRTQSPLA